MRITWVLVIGLLALALPHEVGAKKRHHRRYQGPPPTHPVVLWSRTLDESKEPRERLAAAFKLSQYTQPIFQPKVVATLLACAKDPDVQIKVLCTKALGGVKSASQEEAIRSLLLAQYSAEPMLKNTIVRVFLSRKDESPDVQKVMEEAMLQTEESEQLLVLLRYFEKGDSTPKDLPEKLVHLYEKRSDIKVRRSIIKVLAELGSGEDKVIELLANCAQERDTPLSLNCLSGLQRQAKKDARAWAAVEKTILIDDPDVLLATLDVINALPENKNPILSKRLLELVNDVEDTDIQEKAVLALGVCGDQSEQTVAVLRKVFKNEKTEEGTRIAAALTLGKQAAAFPTEARELLSGCMKESTSQSLKTACKLGLGELPAESKATSPASVSGDKESRATPKAPAKS